MSPFDTILSIYFDRRLARVWISYTGAPAASLATEYRFPLSSSRGNVVLLALRVFATHGYTFDTVFTTEIEWKLLR
jgi:hypothetical protein